MIRECEECHNAINWRRKTGAKFCSNACKMRDYRRRTREPIPAELRRKARWVNWRMEDGKKVPRRPTGPKANVVQPSTWSTFGAVVGGNGDGVGFVLNGDGIACVDIDDCVLPNGNLTWAAEELIRKAEPTFVEISPSGRGVHVWGYGKMARSGRNRRFGVQRVEAYSTARYICVTGDEHAISGGRMRSIQPLINFIETL